MIGPELSSDLAASPLEQFIRGLVAPASALRASELPVTMHTAKEEAFPSHQI